MTVLYTATFVKEHEELLEQVEHVRLAALQVPALPPEQRVELVGSVLDFLQGTLVPHARDEERSIYRDIGEGLAQPAAIELMLHDHIAIRERIADLADTRPSDAARLQELLYGLYALITVHFRKEEQLFASALRRRS